MVSYDVFEMVGLDYNASSEEIELKIQELKNRSSRYGGNELCDKLIIKLEECKAKALDREKIEGLLEESPKFVDSESGLSKETREALDYFSDDEKVQEKPKKKKKSYKLQRKLIAAGLIIAICLSTVLYAKNKHDQNILNDARYNVCVEYRIQEGDTMSWAEDHFEDRTYIHTQFVGPNYNYKFLYEGDTMIARTTIEEAQALEAKGVARIISIDEAIEILEQTGSSLIGKFREYKENNIKNEAFVFFEPEGRYTI